MVNYENRQLLPNIAILWQGSVFGSIISQLTQCKTKCECLLQLKTNEIKKLKVLQNKTQLFNKNRKANNESNC